MSEDAQLRRYIMEACFPDFPSRVRFASVLDTPLNIFIFLDFLFRICLEVFPKQTPCRKGGGGCFWRTQSVSVGRPAGQGGCQHRSAGQRASTVEEHPPDG